MKKIYFLQSCLLLVSFIVNAQTTTNEVSITRDGITFTFSISCDNGPCQTGQFVNGDPWVVPNNPGGTVTISAITPNGPLNGAMVNPDLYRDPNDSSILLPTNQQRQGLLSSYWHYNPNLDIMNSLPYNAQGNESIIKIVGSNENCGPAAIALGCVKSAAILTVLDSPPISNGSTTFRPPFHGNWKPQYITDKVRMNRLPNLPEATNVNPDVLSAEFGFEHWLTPEVELYHNHTGGFGEFHRAMIPQLAQPNYAADQALLFVEDLTKLFGTETSEQKRMATYSLIQKGIDNYGVYKMGVPFSSGAGQHLGKKPAIVFFAAMYDDNDLLQEVRGMASNTQLLETGFFQEDAQIRMGNSGMSIWGDFRNPNDAHWYFSRLYPNIDSNGTMGDPYGYIDGPAGGLHPDETATNDRNYLPVVGGPYVGYSLLQHLMPWLKYASNDFEILQWSDRIYDGYGIDNFDGGLWTLPDPVAPFDSTESEDCKPFRMYSTGITDCTLYGQTWGPDLNNLQNFIPHNLDPMTHGRMPSLHGFNITLTRIPTIVMEHWNELRPCADPDSSDYPCQGLGEIPNEDTLGTPGVSSQIKPDYNVYVDDNRILIKTFKNYSVITLNLYNISGSLIDSKKGVGNEIELNRYFGAGFYIFILRLDGQLYSGKIAVGGQ